MRYNRNYIKLLILIIFLTVGFNCISQTNMDSKFLQGSEKFKSLNCIDSCVIVFKNFTVITKAHKQSPGEDIMALNTKNQKRLVINVGGEYHAQYFYGLYGNIAVIDYGTSAIRIFYIYDLDNKRIINSINGIDKKAKIINGKLNSWIVMSKEKIKKNKLQEGQCLSEACGFYEEINYNFKTNNIEFSGKYEWRN
jgi:hypothetical protein